MAVSGRADSAYWARFERDDEVTFRFDTRIYLTPRGAPRGDDRPLGCIIGKNPGSAIPLMRQTGLQAIALQGDRFLPTVRAILIKAFRRCGRPLPENAYVQVLNLFYLCNRDLRAAKAALDAVDPLRCASERRRFPWQWYAWGGPDRQLDPLKRRFLHARRCDAFFVDRSSVKVLDRRPRSAEHARHTQGMGHDAVVAHLAALLEG